MQSVVTPLFESANETVSYVGPERRTRGNGLWLLLAAVLDEVDYGLMLVADGTFARAHNLSGREEEVLGCLCAGMKPAEIARQLRVSESTVRTHVHNLKAKAHCTSMVDLVKRVAVLPPIMTALKAGPLHTLR
ncbi:MAG: hypothetical protein C4K60_12460 [Ideonella sp. MAG2]|nr:MAG: hypothetical protein C4K60_12460 [Ideonella sp. MAG2]